MPPLIVCKPFSVPAQSSGPALVWQDQLDGVNTFNGGGVGSGEWWYGNRTSGGSTTFTNSQSISYRNARTLIKFRAEPIRSSDGNNYYAQFRIGPAYTYYHRDIADRLYVRTGTDWSSYYANGNIAYGDHVWRYWFDHVNGVAMVYRNQTLYKTWTQPMPAEQEFGIYVILNGCACRLYYMEQWENVDDPLSI